MGDMKESMKLNEVEINNIITIVKCRGMLNDLYFRAFKIEGVFSHPLITLLQPS